MKTSIARGITVAALLALFGYSSPAGAAPIIEVDLDPLTPGTQFTRTVEVGSTFTVDVLILDDGLAPSPFIFDTIILGTSFNDMGAVLGPGPTGFVAGSLASFPASSDVATAAAVTPGAALLPIPGPLPPSPGFASFLGPAGLIYFSPFSASVGVGSPFSVYSVDFTALGLGMSTILAAGSPPGSPELASAGMAIFAGLFPATVTVVPATVAPEPGSLLVFGSGLAGLLLLGRRIRRKRDPAV